VLSGLDLSKNKDLILLSCYNNQLTNLNISNNPVLGYLSTRNNPNLFCIKVSDTTEANNKPYWYKDDQAVYSEDCGYPWEIDYTYVPDDNFEQALIDLGYDSGPLNDSIPTANIDTVSYLNIEAKNISDLTGIEDFVAIVTLICNSNGLKSLDLSKNIALEKLVCGKNRLISLDISKNLALKELECDANQLKSLDLRNNTALESINCPYNQLTSLDLNHNMALRWLGCDDNELTDLDLSKNTELEILYCPENQLTSLDLSKNSTLEELFCYGNVITNLDLSKNPSLFALNCHNNKLTSLDISKNTTLNWMYCSSNQLSSLDLSNNLAMNDLDARSNPNLFCIQVSDSVYATQKYWWRKDDWAIYSEDCSTVGVDEEINVSNDISISPNPASDYIEINLERWSPSSGWTPSEIQIYNSLGECVINYELRITNYEKERIDISSLPPGMYYLKIGYFINKFVKM